ncbi:response regulator [Sphingoaurantiacus capsulatus]|uniref:Response regulator n=1 Tax=Sphingoaurantiacus capsulatus TaxID=1771310 RepID=A0ABV7XFJ7_9SPHN
MSNTTATVLIVDDEAGIRRLLRGALERGGYAVIEAENARMALNVAEARHPEVILLDLGLPDRDGLELLPSLRARSDAAILIVSAREATDEKVAALDLGADDYVTKPFDSEELLARVRATLRQRSRYRVDASVVRAGEVEIDLVNRRVAAAGAAVHLKPKEYSVLAELAKHPGRVMTHAQLLRAIWGPAHERDVEYLRVAVRGIRQKLRERPGEPGIISNEPGVGYRLNGAASEG